MPERDSAPSGLRSAITSSAIGSPTTYSTLSAFFIHAIASSVRWPTVRMPVPTTTSDPLASWSLPDRPPPAVPYASPSRTERPVSIVGASMDQPPYGGLGGGGWICGYIG